MIEKCAVCFSRLPPDNPNGLGLVNCTCPRCGPFVLIGTADDVLQRHFTRGTIDRSYLSHRIRRMPRPDGKNVQIFEEDLSQFAGHPGPNPKEQFDNLILWVGANQKSQFVFAEAATPEISAYIGTPIGEGGNEQGFDWLWHQIGTKGILNCSSDGQKLKFRLTMDGWTRYEELRTSSGESRIAFMAMKFGNAELDRVLNECFKPAAQAAGFDLRPLNENQGAGLIDNQIRAAVRSAAFVVADLTHDNNGAYFEAGFAEGLGKHVIYTCEQNKFDERKTHFDTNHMVTIRWSADDLSHAAALLTATIRNTLPDKAGPAKD